MPNEKYQVFKKIVRECNYDNTYKMAWAKALVELSGEVEMTEENVTITLLQIAEKYLKYYWNQTIFFDLIQGSNPNKPPVVVSCVKRLIDSYYAMVENKKPIRYERLTMAVEALSMNENLAKTIEDIVDAIKQDVSWRFLNVQGNDIKVYDYKKGDPELRIEASFLQLLHENEQDLYDLINYRWGMILETFNNSPTGISLVHILDACNFKADGQYPEAEMKVQNIQGYCLLLDINEEIDYYSADMRAVFYAVDLDGLWQEIEICNEKLTAFSFDDVAITCKGTVVNALAENAKQKYAEKLHEEKLAREEEKRRREAYEKEQRELAEKRRIEQQKLWEEAEKRRVEEAEKRRIEEAAKAEELRRLQEIEEEKRKEAQRQAELADAQYIKEHINQQTERVLDSRGVRWIKCEFCDKVAPDGEFVSYGGTNRINLGTCKECSKNNPNAQFSKILEKQEETQIKKRDPNECPICGGRIIEKMGRYGRFLTCSNYPKCDYKPPKRW